MRGIENPSSLLRMTLLAFWSCVQIFVLCDSSERVITHFKAIDIYQCDWYAFPICVRRTLPIVIVNTQQPVVLKGVANIQCTRNTFRKVSHLLLDSQKFN